MAGSHGSPAAGEVDRTIGRDGVCMHAILEAGQGANSSPPLAPPNPLRRPLVVPVGGPAFSPPPMPEARGSADCGDLLRLERVLQARAEAHGGVSATFRFARKDAGQAGRSWRRNPFCERAGARNSTQPRFVTGARCLEFAVGSIASVLGEDYAPVDSFPTRVPLPDEPLMLVDRILAVEGEPRSLGRGRVITEHDVLPGAWYLDAGRIPTSVAVEAGQADLFLSGYLGIDFQRARIGRLSPARRGGHLPLRTARPGIGDPLRHTHRPLFPPAARTSSTFASKARSTVSRCCR